MLKVLITGFEPFGDYIENSSWEVARRVASCGIAGVEVAAEQLPVSFARVAEVLQTKVKQYSPNLVIMLGQSAAIDCVKLERVALNMMDSAMGDNDGVKPDEEPIYEGKESALFTLLPIKRLRSAIEAKGINVKVSNSCGLYVCNRLYYEALRLCGEKGAMKALFIHLPHYEGQPQQNRECPTMSLNDMVRAVEIIIEETNDKNREV